MQEKCPASARKWERKQERLNKKKIYEGFKKYMDREREGGRERESERGRNKGKSIDKKTRKEE